MEERRMFEIEKKLQVFSFGMLQDLVTLSTLLEEQGISLKELKKYFKTKEKYYKRLKASQIKVLEQREKEWIKKTRRCPTCIGPLFLKPIVIPKGKGNLEGYTCHWYCVNENCLFEEYTKDNFKELYTKVMRGEVD